MSLKHRKVSAKTDSPDTTLIRPVLDWNDEHIFSGGLNGQIVQRNTADAITGHQWATIWPGNLLSNPGFEIWPATTPLRWVLAGVGAVLTKEAATVKIGTVAAKVTRVGNDATLVQTVSSLPGIGPTTWYRGQVVTLGGWVQASIANRADVFLDDGVTKTASARHSGGGTYEFLTVTKTLDVAATKIDAGCEVVVGDTAGFFDGLVLCLGTWVENFLPPLDELLIHPVILTANLPAASGTMDGRVIIEDGGAGVKNLILYAGGQRFRVSGGAAF